MNIPSLTPPLFNSPTSPSSHDTISVASTPRSSSSTSSCQLIEIPTKWRPETQHCLDSKIINFESRNDIVRTLVTLLIVKFGSKPSRRQCEQASRALILQYPFLKDDIGPGYVSIFVFLIFILLSSLCRHLGLTRCWQELEIWLKPIGKKALVPTVQLVLRSIVRDNMIFLCGVIQ